MTLSNNLYKMQWATDISALANQARFGIKYYLKGKNTSETSELLGDGIKVCSILEQGARVGQEREILPKQIGYLNAIKPLIDASYDLENMTINANKVSKILNSLLKAKEQTPEDIDFADRFFVSISNVYQRLAFSTLNSLVEEKVFY